MKIYVVTEGCYDDYHIITATTDKKLAYQIEEKFNAISSDVIYVEIFEDAEIFMKSCYFMRFDKGGNVIEFKEQKESYLYNENDGEDSQGNFYVSVITDNEEKAIKIGAERRAMRLAQKNGL